VERKKQKQLYRRTWWRRKKHKKYKKSENISLKNLEFFMLVKGLSVKPLKFFDASLQPTSLETSFQNLVDPSPIQNGAQTSDKLTWIHKIHHSLNLKKITTIPQ
jgi:hypothetical protein